MHQAIEKIRGGLVVSCQADPGEPLRHPETMAQMAHRATHGVRELVRSHPDGFVWIVSHGDIIKAIVADALGVHLDHFQRIVIDTASVSVINFSPRRPFVERLNDTGPIRLARKQDDKGSDAVVGGRASQ